MSQKTSPFLEGAYGWEYGSNGWNTGADENFLKFSFMFDGNVDSIVSTLPAVVNGEAYFLTTDNRLYFGVNNTWYSSPCPKSFIFKIKSNGDFYQFNGSSASKILNPTEVQTRITDIEATLATLGTAAFVSVDSLATQAELDVASAQANAYTDGLVAFTSINTPYVAGITFTEYNQVIRAGGEFWRVAAATTLPYVTTGAGMPEGGKFVGVGDAVLRQGLASETSAAPGAGLIGFIKSLAGAAGMKLSRWLGYQPVTPLDFMTEAQRISVLAGDGIEDVTVPLQAFRDYLASFGAKPPKGILPAGVYKYSSSPNWAIDNLVVKSRGNVFFRHTGTGNPLVFDAGAATQVIYNVKFGHVFVESPPTSGHGVYVRSCHHSHIKATVRGCGTLSSALRAEFAVCTTFDVKASVNQNFRIPGTPASGWYMDAKPLHGIFLTRRNVGEQVSACYFPVPIIEGVADTGIILDHAIMNRFVGGTSEANSTNVVCEVNSAENTFDGIDLEVASSGIGLIDKGDRNVFNEILNDALTQIQATAVGSRVTGGILNGISDSGTGTKLLDLFYGSNGGVISELGVGAEYHRCHNLTSATFDPNKTQSVQIKSGAPIKKHLSATTGLGFVAPPVPGFTAPQNVNVPGAALGDTVVVSCSVAGSANQFLDARVVAADTVAVKWGQLSGAATTPGVGGENYRVDVWGH